MKRIFGITALALALMAAALCGALAVCVRSNAVHQFVIARVNAAIPGTITFERLRISLFSMRAEMRGLALADPTGKKLAGFDRFFVDISALGLLRGAIVVQKAVVEGPWASIEIDTSGHWRLLDAFPHWLAAPSDTIAKQQSAPIFLPIEVRSLSIIGGNVYFVSEKDNFAVQANGLSIAASGETRFRSAGVTGVVDSVNIMSSRKRLIVHDVFVTARIRNMDVDTLDFRARTGGSTLHLFGTASSMKENPSVNITAEADIALPEICSAVGLQAPLGGKTTMRLRVFGAIANPVADFDVLYDGGNIYGYSVKSIFIRGRLFDRVVTIMPLRIVASAGRADVSGNVDLRGMFPQGLLAPPGSAQKIGYQLTISGKGISLGELAPGISGTAEVSMAIHGCGVHPDSLDAAAVMKAGVTALQFDASQSPLDAVAACSVTVAQGKAQVRRLKGRIGGANIFLTGVYGIASATVDAALDVFVPSLGALLAHAGVDSVSGSAAIAARIGGDLRAPRAAVRLNADSVAYNALRIGNIALEAELDTNGIARVNQLTLINRKSRVQLTGVAQVHDKKALVSVSRMPFDFSLNAGGLVLGDFFDSIGGTADIHAHIKGTADALDGYARFSATDVIACGQRAAKIALDARFEHQRVRIEPLRIALAPGQELTVSGWASLKDSFDVALFVPGMHLSALAAVRAMDSLDGVASLNLQVNGTYARPTGRGRLEVNSIRMGSMKLDDMWLELDLRDQQVAANGKVIGNVNAGYNLDAKTLRAAIDFAEIDLAPYLALSGQRLNGALTGTATLFGNADSLTDITGSVHIKNLVIGYKDLRLIETHDLHASLESRRYSIPDFRIALAGEGSLTGRAQGVLDGTHDVTVSGIVPLSIARHFTEDLPDIEGSVTIDAAFAGSAKAFDLNGDIRLKNIGMSVSGLSQRLHSLNGRILADREALRIESLRGNLDDGVLSMHGELRLNELAPARLMAEITLEDLPLSVPDMLDVTLDGTLSIAGCPDTVQVAGDVVVLDGLYYQDIIINPLGGLGQRKRKETPPAREYAAPYLKNMRFDVGVQARSPLRVDNNLAQLTIVPDLQLRGSLQTPVLNGRANVVQGAITYQKKVFTVERGIIDFVNPYAVEPEIDISGSVPVRDWTIRIMLSGTPNNLMFRLSSDDPGLEDQDILSLLVLGKTTAELQSGLQHGRFEGQSNQQMLAALAASTFGEDIRKAAGLDMLEVEAGEASNSRSDRIAVTIGKQLTKRLGTKYTVESENGEIVQRTIAEYRILQNLLLLGFQDTKGVYGGGVRLSWERR